MRKNVVYVITAIHRMLRQKCHEETQGYLQVVISSFMKKQTILRHVALNKLKPNVPIYDGLCTFIFKYCRTEESILSRY